MIQSYASFRFFYTSQLDRGALSTTLITCSSPIRWSFQPSNSTNSILVTKIMETYHSRQVVKGVYTLQVVALEQNTQAHIYISTEEGGPEALQSAKLTTLKLLKRQRRKRFTVKWSQSLVDPRDTDYCLVVSSKRFHDSLCALNTTQSDPRVACVGRSTHYTLSDLKQGERYYFNLFATNHQSNFTYPYGRISTIVDSHHKPPPLKDGKSTFVNLKKFDGKAVFRYKIGKNVTKPFDVFVMPCGGAVDVEVTLKDFTVIPTRRIEGFGKISIAKPVKTARYYIKIFALNQEELKKTNGVEIYATTKSTKIPFPNMPQVVKLQEYEGKKTCDSVTVGWIVAPAPKKVHYCVIVKKAENWERNDFTTLNQCGLDSRLQKSNNFVVKYCTDHKSDQETVIVREIKQLKPRQNYVVQVVIKKPKGKSLSYDLLHVYTQPSCRTNISEDGSV